MQGRLARAKRLQTMLRATRLMQQKLRTEQSQVNRPWSSIRFQQTLKEPVRMEIAPQKGFFLMDASF
jgi:hypothetical protein